MKIRTSVKLSDALLKEIDRVDTNSSAFLERSARDLRDAKLLDRHAARLSREATDVLEYQGLVLCPPTIRTIGWK